MTPGLPELYRPVSSIVMDTRILRPKRYIYPIFVLPTLCKFINMSQMTEGERFTAPQAVQSQEKPG